MKLLVLPLVYADTCVSGWNFLYCFQILLLSVGRNLGLTQKIPAPVVKSYGNLQPSTLTLTRPVASHLVQGISCFYVELSSETYSIFFVNTMYDISFSSSTSKTSCSAHCWPMFSGITAMCVTVWLKTP